MDEKTLTALKTSIKHWEENVAAEIPNEVKVGPKHCALCGVFREIEGGYAYCVGCPVKLATGADGCKGSPYDAADRRLDDWEDFVDAKHRYDFREAAQAEVDFLKSLLPEGAA